jgi:uncharacterized delta-60 repeat protein
LRRILPLLTILFVVLARPAFAGPGSLDRTFSRNGFQTAFASGGSARAVAVDVQGRILLAGSTIGARADIAVARLLPGGALDGSFNGDGRFRLDLGVDEEVFDVTVAAGNVVVVGERHGPTGTKWFVIRLRPNGTLDPTFGGDGRVITDFGRRFEHARTVRIQPDGRILVAGSVSNGTSQSWAFARYLDGGALDGSFGGDGRVTMSLSASNEEVQTLVVRSTDILAGGYAERNYLPRFAIAKLRFDGSRVLSFARRGVRLVNLAPGADSAYGLAVQDDGKPVLAGYASDGGRADWGIVRLRTSGALDGSFSGDGIVMTRFTPAYELAAAVSMQSNGRIVVAGRVHGPGGSDDLAVVRYLPDGRLDFSFSGNGKALFDPYGGNDGAQDVLVRAGKILLVGEASRGLVQRMIVYRLFT